MNYDIEISELTKEFIPAKSFHQLILRPFCKEKPVLALDKLSLQVKKGEMLTIVGPNGAGKTTLIKILSCLILPTRGKVEVCGYDISKEEKIKSSIGLVNGDERSFYWKLTLRENLYFFAALYNLSGVKMRIKIKELA